MPQQIEKPKKKKNNKKTKTTHTKIRAIIKLNALIVEKIKKNAK